MDPLVIAFGLGVGVLVGLTGIGGGSLSHRIPATALRPALGCVMLGSALGVISKAGADLPAWEILGPPVLVGIGAYAFQRKRTRLAAAVSTA